METLPVFRVDAFALFNDVTAKYFYFSVRALGRLFLWTHIVTPFLLLFGSRLALPRKNT